jgi:hypothetical protein
MGYFCRVKIFYFSFSGSFHPPQGENLIIPKACQAFAKHAVKLVAADKKAALGTAFTVRHAPKEFEEIPVYNGST